MPASQAQPSPPGSASQAPPVRLRQSGSASQAHTPPVIFILRQSGSYRCRRRRRSPVAARLTDRLAASARSGAAPHGSHGQRRGRARQRGPEGHRQRGPEGHRQRGSEGHQTRDDGWGERGQGGAEGAARRVRVEAALPVVPRPPPAGPHTVAAPAALRPAADVCVCVCVCVCVFLGGLSWPSEPGRCVDMCRWVLSAAAAFPRPSLARVCRSD